MAIPAKGFVTLGSACWIWVVAVAEGHEENQLRRIPVPAGDHTAGNVALPPDYAELSSCRRCDSAPEWDPGPKREQYTEIEQ